MLTIKTESGNSDVVSFTAQYNGIVVQEECDGYFHSHLSKNQAIKLYDWLEHQIKQMQ